MISSERCRFSVGKMSISCSENVDFLLTNVDFLSAFAPGCAEDAGNDDGFCIKNDGFCIKHDQFCSKQ